MTEQTHIEQNQEQAAIASAEPRGETPTTEIAGDVIEAQPENTKPKGPIQEDVYKLLDLITEYSELLTGETKALREAEFKVVDSLQERKKELTLQYQDVVTTLQNRKLEVGQLENKLRETVIVARSQFTKILQENLEAIENVKASSKRIVDRIIESAREAIETNNTPNYNATGYNNSSSGTPVSISIDQQL